MGKAKKAPRNPKDDDGKKVARKKTISSTAKAPKKQESPCLKSSKYVGVDWNGTQWRAEINVFGKKKKLGLFDDEKEAARVFDEQAALLGRPMNFPQQEGQKQAVKKAKYRKGRAEIQQVDRPSKYVGVNWNKQERKWQASIVMNGRKKNLGYYEEEKEAARVFDEQAALLSKPVNFPLHEGQKQAVKKAFYRKDRSQIQNAGPSKFVGVSWHAQGKKWQAEITVNGKVKSLGLFGSEQEAARTYDEQAALHNKPVNFPLHEGEEQVVKRAPNKPSKKA